MLELLEELSPQGLIVVRREHACDKVHCGLKLQRGWFHGVGECVLGRPLCAGVHGVLRGKSPNGTLRGD
eukprot:scaffold66004_cov64-Phaeocystis_antarctica.AAC.3